jgi:hypothetical protein
VSWSLGAVGLLLEPVKRKYGREVLDLAPCERFSSEGEKDLTSPRSKVVFGNGTETAKVQHPDDFHRHFAAL